MRAKTLNYTLIEGHVTDPSLTVAVVNLNMGSDLPLTIESIIGQSYNNIQLIIFDGYSFDESYDILKRYRSSLDVVHRVEDSGIYDAMNRAAQVADGDYILFLNAGDRFYAEDVVEVCMDRIEDEPDIFYGDHVYVDGHTEKYVRAAHFDLLQMQLHSGQIDHAWHVQVPCHQATFTRTSLLRDMPYDTRYAICADHDFLFRAHSAGSRTQYVDEIVCHYIAGGMSASQGTIIHREWAHAYRKHSLRPLDVDRFFFQADAQSPFPTFNAHSGVILDGIKKEVADTAQGERLMLVDNHISLRSPQSTETIGLHLKGSIGDTVKRMTLLSDEKLLGAEIIQPHSFDFHSPFIRPLPPAQALDIYIESQGMGTANDGMILNRLHFIDSHWIFGDAIKVRDLNHSILEKIFVDGWITRPDDHENIWSNADQPSIAFSTGRQISELTFSCLRDDGDEYMDISVIINGIMVKTFGISPKIRCETVTVSVEDSWNTGANIIRLSIDRKSKKKIPKHISGFAINKISWSYLV